MRYSRLLYLMGSMEFCSLDSVLLSKYPFLSQLFGSSLLDFCLFMPLCKKGDPDHPTFLLPLPQWPRRALISGGSPRLDDTWTGYPRPRRFLSRQTVLYFGSSFARDCSTMDFVSPPGCETGEGDGLGWGPTKRRSWPPGSVGPLRHGNQETLFLVSCPFRSVPRPSFLGFWLWWLKYLK